MTDTYDLLQWDTNPLYPAPNSPELESQFARAAAAASSFRSDYREKVAGLDPVGLLRAINDYEALNELIIKPQLYAHLLFAANSTDDTNKRLSQHAAEFGNLMSRELLFFDLELIHMSDEPFISLSTAAELVPYRHYLEGLRKFRLHTLPEREETLLKQKSLTGVDAFSRLFDELSASFRFTFEIEGESREVTGEELLALLHHPGAGVRERAFATFLQRHEEHGIVYTTIFNTIALDHGQELELRNFQTPMEPTNLGNEIPEEVVNRLMEVSESNYVLAQDYFRMKARLLGVTKLKNSDIYAPIGSVDRRYTFAEAKDLVLTAYSGFNAEFAAIGEAFFSDRRIDVLPRPGKSGGAFCMGMTPSLPPYILLNFTGTLRDVSTIAHELGHGIHFVLAQKQSILNYHAPLPLAETASVFGEMLLTRHLLARETDPAIKISLLCAKIEDIIATTFRQNVLTRFEERLHRERQQGLLTAGELCELWWQENTRLYGDAVEMIEPYRWGWSYISHFIHARFYCYSYTFAELLVLSLYQKYCVDGDRFIPIYREILASGGSHSPAETVLPAGIDLADPDFWQQGYNALQVLIAELKELIVVHR